MVFTMLDFCTKSIGHSNVSRDFLFVLGTRMQDGWTGAVTMDPSWQESKVKFLTASANLDQTLLHVSESDMRLGKWMSTAYISKTMIPSCNFIM